MIKRTKGIYFEVMDTIAIASNDSKQLPKMNYRYHRLPLLIVCSFRTEGKLADTALALYDLIVRTQITSLEHFEDVLSRAGGADESAPDGYQDALGRWRHPHKLMVVEVYAGWCRVCKGLQPKILKLMKQHPEVLCCKINKTANEVLVQ